MYKTDSFLGNKSIFLNWIITSDDTKNLETEGIWRFKRFKSQGMKISITLKCILSTFIEDAEVGTYDGVSMDSACNTAHKTASAYISEIKPKI